MTNYIETYKGYKASLPPPLIQEMFALRKASFIDSRNWDIDSYSGGGDELDSYDDEDSFYILLAQDSRCTATVRLRPSQCRNFTREQFGLSFSLNGTADMNIWEASRFCINSNMHAHRKRKELDIRTVSIFHAMVEHGLTYGIDNYKIVIDKAMHRILCRSDWHLVLLNEGTGSRNEATFYCFLPCNLEQLNRLSHIIKD
ncbi:acyl homoserine lactone synthase [Chromohalobacter marismortui]|uniref:Acyl-homoserine-lactone synthase n=1 Tax=Chromohalobacter marismortui TaxID=42055 RepID=A0A4V3F412_9GAMM|nr:acyl-homoserine-lactone synthase [Chromohalobacter marismortui]TDU23516.1 acyl homoserine lactone synthase [Chromohalobacter marismortui]